MVRSRKGGSSIRKSARLEEKRRKIRIDESEGTNLSSQLNTDSESEEDLVVVHQEEESVVNLPQVPDPNEWRERSTTLDFEEEVVLGFETDKSSGANMPTCLKYNKFRGDRS